MPLPFSDAEAGPFGQGALRGGSGGLFAGYLSRLKDGWHLLRPQPAAIPPHDLILCRRPQGWEMLEAARGRALVPAGAGQSLDTPQDALAALKQRQASSRQALRVLLLVPEDVVLLEPLSVAAMPEAERDQVFSAAIARLSPFPAEAAVSVIVRVGARKDDFRYLLAVFDRRLIEDCLDLQQETGARLAGLGVHDGATIRLASALPSEPPRGIAQSWAQLPVLLRSACLGLGLLAAVFAAVLSINTTRADALRAGAGAASERLAERTRRAELEQAAAAQKEAAHGLIGALEQLSADLPDGAWLELFQLDDGKATLTFYAPSANETRSLVQAIPGFSEVVIDGTITRDAEAKIERFVITARLDAAGKAAAP